METSVNRQLGQGILIALAVVILFSLGGRALKAIASGPPAKVIENTKAEVKNQKILTKNRPAYEAFMDAKQDNERLEKENVSLGWRTDWATLQPVPLGVPFPPRP